MLTYPPLQKVRAERDARLQQHATNCVRIAVVASVPIAAELIDKAISYAAGARDNALGPA